MALRSSRAHLQISASELRAQLPANSAEDTPFSVMIPATFEKEIVEIQ